VSRPSLVLQSRLCPDLLSLSLDNTLRWVSGCQLPASRRCAQRRSPCRLVRAIGNPYLCDLAPMAANHTLALRQCPGGSPSCSYANITNGTADASLSGSHQNGTVGCMLVLESGPPISQTSASPSACLSPGPSAGSSVNTTPQWSNSASVPGSLNISTQSSLGPPFLNTSARPSAGASVQSSLTVSTQSSSGSLSAGGAPGTAELSVPSGTTPTSAVAPVPQASSGDGVDSAATRLSIRTSLIVITSTITSTITLF
jgi:hypothetical protein